MLNLVKQLFDRFTPAGRRNRILVSVNKLMAKEGHAHIADPEEQTIAYLSYKEANAHSATQNATIVIALSALLVAIIFTIGTAFESVFSSSKSNESMQNTDEYYAIAFAGTAWILVTVVIAFCVSALRAIGTGRRSAVLEVVRNRSALPPATRMQIQAQAAEISGKRQLVFALINVNRRSSS